MQQSKKTKALAALSAAAAIGMYGHVAKGVLLTQYYVSAEIATTSNFAAGTFTTVTINQSAPAMTISPGEYLEYGISDVLTQNNGTAIPNQVSGDNWDTQNQNDGNTAVPTHLGLGTLAYSVPSTDANGSLLQPLNTGVAFGTDPGNNQPDYPATAAINSNLTKLAYNPTSNPGDNENNNGNVGLKDPIFIGYNPGYVDTQGTQGAQENSDIANLGFFSGNNTSIGSATTFFTGLKYKGVSGGSVTLTPSVVPNGTGYWQNGTLGTTGVHTTTKYEAGVTSDPSYFQMAFGSGDSVAPLAPLVVTIASAAPAGPVITLTGGATTQTLPELLDQGTGAGGAHKGVFAPASSQSILAVSGHNGNYTVASVANINSGAGDAADYVQINGFTPANDVEIYALKLAQNGTLLTPSGNASLLSTIVADINTANDSTFLNGTNFAQTPTQEASSDPSVVADLNGVLGGGWDVYLNIPTSYMNTLTPGDAEYNFGFNFSGYTDGSISNITVPDLAVVPEPGAMMGVLSLGALAMFSYRKRKPAEIKA